MVRWEFSRSRKKEEKKVNKQILAVKFGAPRRMTAPLLLFAVAILALTGIATPVPRAAVTLVAVAANADAEVGAHARRRSGSSIAAQIFDAGTHDVHFDVLLSLDTPLRTSGVNSTATPDATNLPIALDSVDNSECADDPNTVCRQVYSFTIDPNFASQAVCELDGTYTLVFNVECQPSTPTNDCDTANPPATMQVVFVLDSENLCETITDSVSVATTLTTYASVTFNANALARPAAKSEFVDGATVHFVVDLSPSDSLPIESVAITDVSIRDADGNVDDVLVAGVIAIAQYAYASAGTAGLVGSAEDGLSPEVTFQLTLDPSVFGTVARGAPVTSEVNVTLDIEFDNTDAARRRRRTIALAVELHARAHTQFSVSAATTATVVTATSQTEAPLATATVQHDSDHGHPLDRIQSHDRPTWRAEDSADLSTATKLTNSVTTALLLGFVCAHS